VKVKNNSRKIINTSKFIRLDWLKEQQLLDVCELLEHQGIDKFLGLTRNVYTNLVKVFFTNLKMHEDKLESRVKGIRMLVSSAKWWAVIGIKCEGIKIAKGNV